MNIKDYLESTYLKTAVQAGISESDNLKLVIECVQEAINEDFKVVMIRPEMVSLAKKMVLKERSKLGIGTVIDFPSGNATVLKKLIEAKQAIIDGADDLDFVCNYEAFKNGKINAVKDEILRCTQLGIRNHKVVKWIIEVAALNNDQIIQLSALIKNVVLSNFKEENYAAIFVKSSTGFYSTNNNLPNGATISSSMLMLENAFPLSVKASGGIKNYEDTIKFIHLGVKRIGTSSAKAIVTGSSSRQ